MCISLWNMKKSWGVCAKDVQFNSRRARVFEWSNFGTFGNIHSNLVNSKASELEVLSWIIGSSNYREVYINIHNPPKWLLSFFFLSNISFGLVKETSQWDVSFVHPKHMLLKTVIKIDHENVLLSESSVSQNYFEFSNFSKIWSSNFQSFTE